MKMPDAFNTFTDSDDVMDYVVGGSMREERELANELEREAMYEAFFELDPLSNDFIKDKTQRVREQAYFSARKSFELMLKYSYDEKKLAEKY